MTVAGRSAWSPMNGFDMCASSQLNLTRCLFSVMLWHPCSIRCIAGGLMYICREDYTTTTSYISRREVPRSCRAHHSTGKRGKKERKRETSGRDLVETTTTVLARSLARSLACLLARHPSCRHRLILVPERGFCDLGEPEVS